MSSVTEYPNAFVCGQRLLESTVGSGTIVGTTDPPIEVVITDSPGGYQITGLQGGVIPATSTIEFVGGPPCLNDPVSVSETTFPAFMGPIFVAKPLADPNRIVGERVTPLNCGLGCTGTETVRVDLTREPATIEVIKNLEPADDSGRFDLLIDDTVVAPRAGDGATSGAVPVAPGSHTVSEESALNTAGAATRLDNYSTTIQCIDRDTGALLTGSGRSMTVSVDAGEGLRCTITNVLNLRADLSEAVRLPDPRVYAPGETVRVEHQVTNTGPDQATGVRVSLQHDPRLQVQSVTPGPGGTCESTTSCSLPTLPAAGSFAVEVTYQANQAGEDMLSASSVSAATPDPDTTDNAGSLQFDVSAGSLIRYVAGFNFVTSFPAINRRLLPDIALPVPIVGADWIVLSGDPAALAKIQGICMIDHWIGVLSRPSPLPTWPIEWGIRPALGPADIPDGYAPLPGVSTSASNGIQRAEDQPGGQVCVSGTRLVSPRRLWADSNGILWSSIAHGVSFRIILRSGRTITIDVPRETEQARRSRLVDVDEREPGEFRIP